MFRARWRRWVRERTPNFLYDRGLAPGKVADCGDHEWYASTAELDGCYHCRVMRESVDATFERIKSLRKGSNLNGLQIRDLIDEGRR